MLKKVTFRTKNDDSWQLTDTKFFCNIPVNGKFYSIQ